MEEIDLDNVASIFVTKDEEDKDVNYVTIKKVGEEKHKNVVMIRTDDEKKIHVKRDKNIVVIKDSVSDEENEVILGDEDSRFFYIKDDGKRKPLYYIDGKKSESKDFKNMSPDEIESISVLKGDTAVEKYGKKAKNGVIEVTTKKGN